MPSAPCKPGQIYKIWLDDHTQKFVVVVSREELNRGDRCIAVMLTTQKLAERARLGNSVYLGAGRFGLTENCVAKCESIEIYYYDEFVDEIGLVGTLDDDHWEELVVALGYVINASCYTI